MTSAFISLATASSGYPQLAETLRALAAGGPVAEPVLIGEGSTPQAALISVEMFNLLADHIDGVLSAPGIYARLAATDAAGGPITTTLEELAAAAGVDPSPKPPRTPGGRA